MSKYKKYTHTLIVNSYNLTLSQNSKIVPMKLSSNLHLKSHTSVKKYVGHHTAQLQNTCVKIIDKQGKTADSSCSHRNPLNMY